jgi:hypothetical protein
MNLRRAGHSAVTLRHARTHIVLLAMSHTLLSSALGESLICRWVDDKGRTQIADVVPDRYASVATCTDSKQHELTPDQQRAAAQRKASDQSKARSDIAKPPKKTASSPSRPMAAASQPIVKRPKEVVTDTTDCATWWRIYDESGECFGPYKTLRGIRPEAFDNCNEVPSPEPKCGLRIN